MYYGLPEAVMWKGDWGDGQRKEIEGVSWKKIAGLEVNLLKIDVNIEELLLDGLVSSWFLNNIS